MPQIKDFITPTTIRFAEVAFTNLVEFALEQAAKSGQKPTRSEIMAELVKVFGDSAEMRTEFDNMLAAHRDKFPS